MKLQPKESVIQAFEKTVELMDKERKNGNSKYRADLKSDMKKVDTQIHKFIGRI